MRTDTMINETVTNYILMERGNFVPVCVEDCLYSGECPGNSDCRERFRKGPSTPTKVLRGARATGGVIPKLPISEILHW